MKRWFGLLTIVLMTPALGDTNYGTPATFDRYRGLVVSVRNVEKQAAKFADWNIRHASPVGNYEFRKVMLCQDHPWGVPKTEPRSCYPLIWARSLSAKAGYIRADTSYPGVKVNDPNAWYRVSRKWNFLLDWRVRPRSSVPEGFTGPASPMGQPEPYYRNGGTQDFPYWDGTVR